METNHPDWTEQEKSSNSLYIFPFLAIGEMIGSPIFGYVYDKKGPIKSVWLLLVVSVIVLLATLIFNEIHKFTIFAYFVAFGWGVMDAFLNNFLNISLGFEFKSKITPFSAQKCMSNIVIFALIMCESTIKTKS